MKKSGISRNFPLYGSIILILGLGFLGKESDGNFFQVHNLAFSGFLYTIARSITLVGVPRVFIDQSSKVVKTHNNNEIRCHHHVLGHKAKLRSGTLQCARTL